MKGTDKQRAYAETILQSIEKATPPTSGPLKKVQVGWLRDMQTAVKILRTIDSGDIEEAEKLFEKHDGAGDWSYVLQSFAEADEVEAGKVIDAFKKMYYSDLIQKREGENGEVQNIQ